MPVAKFFAALVGAAFVLLLLVRPAPTSPAKRYYATMRADLRNLVTAQETFFTDSGRYARGMHELPPERYRPSSGVGITLEPLSDSSWRATAAFVGFERGCTIIVGARDDAEFPEGEPVCEPEPWRRPWVFAWEY